MAKDQLCAVTYDLISLAGLCQIIGDPECRELSIRLDRRPSLKAFDSKSAVDNNCRASYIAAAGHA
jgi:hypothetical protein